MTPPSLNVAREILANAAAKARESGDPFNEIAASAIDVVLAALDQSIHGAATVIKVATPAAATAPIAILIGSLPGMRSIRSREDARELFGRRDGDAVWDAFGRAPTPPVFIAAVPEVPAHPAPVEPARMAPHAMTHGTTIPHEALVAELLPCPFCGSTRLSVAVARPGALFPFVDCAGCGAQGPVRPGAEPARTKREAIAHWNRRAAERAAGPPPVAKAQEISPADLDNLKAIRMAVNRTAYHGGIGLRESGKMLGTLDRLLAAYGVGPDDQPEGGRPEQSIPERPPWPR